MRATIVVWIALGLAAAAAAAQTDVMFVTSATGTGKLSSWPEADGLTGIAAANRICQNLAAAAHLFGASTFEAWISDIHTDAACNIKARSGHPPSCGSLTVNNPGPWQRMDGAPFARSVESLAAGEVLNAPVFDENGGELGAFDGVWTGTDGNGKRGNFDENCADASGVEWNSEDGSLAGEVGYPRYGPVRWTSPSGSSCNQHLRLYCFQHTLLGGPPLAPFEGEGALVFLTSTHSTGDLASSPDAGGQESLAAGDAICRARARAGGLPHPESFHAWLSVVGTDAIDHIGSDGPFKRPDGIQIASSRADLTDGELASPIAETELRTYEDQLAWTGTTKGGLFDDRNCFDFTEDDSSVHGIVGQTSATEGWSSEFPGFCGLPQPIYCFSDQPLFFWSGFEESGGGFWRWSFPGK